MTYVIYDIYIFFFQVSVFINRKKINLFIEEFHKQLLLIIAFFNIRLPCFSEPEINPLFARRAAKAAGKGISCFLSSNQRSVNICNVEKASR